MEQLNSISAILQKLNDQDLHKELISPTGQIPQFLVMSEVQRRKSMRADQPKPNDPTPVAQEMAQEGIAGAPQLSQGAAPEGAGGIQSFADGGSVGKKKQDNASIDWGSIWDKIKAFQPDGGFALEGGSLTPYEKFQFAPNPDSAQQPPVQNPMQPPPVGAAPMPMPASGGNPAQAQPIPGLMERLGLNPSMGAPVSQAPQQAPQARQQIQLPPAPQATPPEEMSQGIGAIAAEPRGMRNNNPGNIRGSASKWQGQTGVDSSGFAVFDTMENGQRALEQNLRSYGTKHGIDTISGVVSRWAPSNENDTAAYTKFVSSKLGIGPNEKIDLSNRDTLTKLQSAITAFENGSGSKSNASSLSGDASGVGAYKSDPSQFMVPVSDTPDRVTQPGRRAASDELAGVQGAAPDYTQAMLDRADKRLGENKGRKNDAFNQALMQTGLAIMAGKSSNALQNIGEGGIKGLTNYQGQVASINDKTDALQQHRDAIMMAQSALKRGDYKTAADMANQYNTSEDRRYGTDVQQRTQDMNARREDMRYNSSVLADDARMKTYMGRDDAMIKTAEIRAGATVAGKSGQDWKQDAAAASRAERQYSSILTSIQKNIATMTLPPEEQHQKALQMMSPTYRRYITGEDSAGGISALSPAPVAKRYKMMPDGTMQQQ